MTLQQFTEHYHAYRKPLYYWILSLSKNKEVAEDVCCQAWALAWEKQDQLQGEFKPWLFRITINQMKLFWRRDSYLEMEPFNENHDEIPDLDDFAHDIEARQIAGHVMGHMRRKNHQALSCHLLGLTIKESAKILRTVPGNAGRWISDAKRKARELCAA